MLRRDAKSQFGPSTYATIPRDSGCDQSIVAECGRRLRYWRIPVLSTSAPLSCSMRKSGTAMLTRGFPDLRRSRQPRARLYVACDRHDRHNKSAARDRNVQHQMFMPCGFCAIEQRATQQPAAPADCAIRRYRRLVTTLRAENVHAIYIYIDTCALWVDCLQCHTLAVYRTAPNRRCL